MEKILQTSSETPFDLPQDSNRFHQEQETVHEIEENFEKVSWNEELLTRWLRRFYGIEVEIKENSDGTFEMPVDTIPDGIPMLPLGYGIKGGGARAVLRSVLQIEVDPPRDIDLVYVGQEEQSVEVSRKLAETYMPDDFDFGYGVEVLEEDYFSSRDFSWNEVLYADGKVTCSKQCLLDTVRNIVRIAEYERGKSYRDDSFSANPKLLAKAVRFVAAARYYGNEKVALDSGTARAVEMGIDKWHIALHLNRSFEQDEVVAEMYVRELISLGFLPETIQNAVEALHYLLKNTDFIFRSEAAYVLDRELQFNNMLDIDYEKEPDEDEFGTHRQASNITPFWHPVK